MRIISKFRDYYDGLSRSDDRSWKREDSEKILPINDPVISFTNRSNDFYSVFPLLTLHVRTQLKNGMYAYESHSYNRSFLFFCGRIFPFTKRRDNCLNIDDEDSYIWSPQDFRKCKQYVLAKKYDNLFSLSNTEKKIDDFFNTLNVPKKFYSLGIEFNYPIILIEQSMEKSAFGQFFLKLTFNPNLKNINFQKIMPCFEAFSQIDSYLFNELANKNEKIPDVPNDVKISSHGFDEFSFRKQSSK